MPYGDRRMQDRDTIERWAEAEGVDLEGEAERARTTLRNVERARSQIADAMGTPGLFSFLSGPGVPTTIGWRKP